MVFSSVLFLYYFLPLALAAYFLTPRALKNTTLLLVSVLFYAWGAPTLIPLVVVLSLFDYCAARMIARKTRFAQQAFIAAILANILSLAYYKYANFFITQLKYLTGIDFPWQEIALPIGISFFTFQKISFLVDIKRGTAEAPKNFFDYLLFVLCFPQLIAGPIVRFETVARQLQQRSHSLGNVSVGLSRFAVGMAKKVLLANPLGQVADSIFALEVSSIPAGFAWIGALAYAMQIYFDFSGYSDMAIGLGRCFGFTFPENFNRPYTSKSITEFWRRWHMTLGVWMKEYLYIPLGGNRLSPTRTYVNLWIVFLLSGLWHGAAWTFILWGGYHGLFLVIERSVLARYLKRVPSILALSYTFSVTLIGWILFRCETPAQALEYLQRMMHFETLFQAHSRYVLAQLVDTHKASVLLIALGISFVPIPSSVVRLRSALAARDTVQLLAALRACAAAGLLLVSGASLLSQSFNPFIYFRF